MALPSPTKVSGKHNAIFEAYYKQVDPKAVGTIQAMDAAKFLKKSALSDVVLSRIWDLSDPNAKGYLDKPGFFVALKLVSLAQCGQVIKMNNIFFETDNPPRVGELPKIMPQKPGNNDWSMKPAEKEKYENLFYSLKPVNGLIHGNSVKKVLLDSKLPMETLGKIWDLADQDRDGSLDKHEFTVAMHLVYQALEKRTVPEVLPLEMQKPKLGAPPPIPPQPAHPAMPKAPSGGFSDGGFVANFPKDIGPPPVPPIPVAIPAPLPPLSSVPSMVPSIQPSSGINLISTEPIIPTATAPITQQPVDWVITPSELLRYEGMFRDSDRDKDGLVSGLEVKNVFLQSGVPQNCLAHIWALCDTHQTGKLTLEQFALAMWMVERKKINIEPPEALTPNMVPPSLRAVVKGVDVVAAEPKPTYSNPELEMISKEIEELSRERRTLETDIAQKEADIRIKSGEIRSLQSELDTLLATLKQLENQKGEAQKRLDDLQAQVNKVKEQCLKQEETINEQEGELNAKRSELQKLKDEETALEKEYEQNRQELEKLSNQLSYTQLGISQVRASLTHLLELERQMTDALLLCKAAVESGDTHIVSEYSLQIEPDFAEPRQLLDKNFEPPQGEVKNPDPFSAASEPIANTTNISGFGHQEAFSSNLNNNNNGWGDGDGDTFHAKFDDGFGGDSFGTKPSNNLSSDPFGDARQTSTSPIPPGKDDFGSDPFAGLHAPTGQGKVLSPNAQKSGPPPRPESPSPALPPKKAKQPPPRPAPPRPLQGPTRPAPPVQDAFGSTGGGGFADFDDFDNKQPSLPPPPLPFLNNSNNKNNENTNSNPITSQTSTTNALTKTNFSIINDSIRNHVNSSSPVSNTVGTTSSSAAAAAAAHTKTYPLSLNNISLTTTASSFVEQTTNTIPTTSNTTLTLNHTHHEPNSNTTVSNVLKNAYHQRPVERSSPKSSLNMNNDTKTKFEDESFNANFMDLLNTNHRTSNKDMFDDFYDDSKQNFNTKSANAATSNSNDKSNSNKNNMQNNNGAEKVNETSAKVIAVTSNVPAPTEFSDDPFKDYRYEDIFNIKDDPFADEDVDEDADDTESSEDPFSSDTKKNSTIIDNSSNSIAKPCELIENFKLTPVSSPVPSVDFTQKNKTSTPTEQVCLNRPPSKERTLSISPRPSSNSEEFTANFADFDAFTSKDNHGSQIIRNNNNNDAENFFSTNNALKANDIFNTTNSMMNPSNNNNNVDKTSTQSDANKNDNFVADFSKINSDNFFDGFNDNFIPAPSSAAVTVAQATINLKANKSLTDPFDAFGDTKTTKSSKIFDTNFEDDFFKNSNFPESTAETFSMSSTQNNNSHSNVINNNSTLDPFGDASFNDAFGGFENVQKSSGKDKQKLSFGKNDLKAWSFDDKKNKKRMIGDGTRKYTTKEKEPQTSIPPAASAEKGVDKYSEDYSKADTFDADFEEAIRRSMVEK